MPDPMNAEKMNPMNAEKMDAEKMNAGNANKTGTVWSPASATGVGSLPGVRPDEAAKLVADELGAFPHLPELPAAGVGADMIGRGAAHLVDLHVEVQPSGWRIADHAGSDERRARSFLARDIDAFDEQLTGHAGPLKVQVAGPFNRSVSNTGTPEEGIVRSQTLEYRPQQQLANVSLDSRPVGQLQTEPVVVQCLS